MFEIIVITYILTSCSLFYKLYNDERKINKIDVKKFFSIIQWSCVPGFNFITLLYYVSDI